MKTLIPVLADMETLAPDFISSSHMVVFDTEIEEMAMYSMEELRQVFPDKNIREIMLELEVEAVICLNYSIMLINFFRELGIDTLKAHNQDLDMNLQLHALKSLEEATFATESTASCSPSACQTCGSSCGT